jgi:membrane protein implicated in regulation of membrane protease activity
VRADPLRIAAKWMVYAGIGTVLWLVLALSDWLPGNVRWRIIAYLVLAVASIYMFVRALSSVRRQPRSDSCLLQS